MAYQAEIAEFILQTRKDVDVSHGFGLGLASNEDEEAEDEYSSGVHFSRTINGFSVIHLTMMDGRTKIAKIC
jgi:hypothetical protein